MRNNVEHYVVKPNTPVYDWPYEYSTPSNNSGCNCNKDSEKLSNSIDNLQSTLAQLQNAVSSMSGIDIHDEEFINILNQAITEYFTVQDNVNGLKELIDSEIENKFGMTSPTDITTLKTQVANLQSQLGELQPIVNNISNLTELSQLDVTELQQYGDNITQITADLTDLQNQLNQLKTTVNGISSNIGDTINDAVQTVLQETTVLDNKVEQLIQNSNKITTIENSLNSHINDTNVHVSAEDKERWNTAAENAASAGSGDYRFKVEEKTLSLEKYTA